MLSSQGKILACNAETVRTGNATYASVAPIRFLELFAMNAGTLQTLDRTSQSDLEKKSRRYICYHFGPFIPIRLKLSSLAYVLYSLGISPNDQPSMALGYQSY